MSIDASILFRFRDLVAPTIENHCHIIEEHGACWWGWWRRPHEKAHQTIWSRLAKASKKQPVTVLLFDSGQGLVYRARVIKTLPPAEKRPAVPKKERDQIPAYYRESRFSFAWMKMDSITLLEDDFFGHWTFARAPELRGFNPKQLQTFTGKIIPDADELRAMDTTIWEVRPKRKGDGKARIMVEHQHVEGALSAKPIAVRGNAILHLSDLHFAPTNGPLRRQHVWGQYREAEPYLVSKLADQVAEALVDRQIGLILISGDLTFMASPQEFEEALAALNILVESLNLDRECLMVVPGNHDLAWTMGQETYHPNAAITNAEPAAKKAYEGFYQALFDHPANRYLSMARRYVFPHGGLVEVGGLNSSSLNTGANFLAGMGKVHPSAFGEICNVLNWKPHDTAPSHALRLLMQHHHLTNIENHMDPAEFTRGFGMAVDAAQTLRDAADHGIHLALHGHRHRPFFWRSTVYHPPDETAKRYGLGAVAILGGGSAGSSEVAEERNTFNLITVQPDGLTVELFASQKLKRFRPITEWFAPLTMAEGRLLLGDWRAPIAKA